MKHVKWLEDVTGGDSVRAVARVSGIPSRTVADQVKKGRFSPESVIAIAVGYARHPVTALVDCGYLPEQFALTADPVAALRQASDDDIAAEVLRRMKLGGNHAALTTPVDELPAPSPHEGEPDPLTRLETWRDATIGEVQNSDDRPQQSG